MPEPNTLGLDDDLEGVSLLMRVEQAFDLTVGDAEAERIVTMGDLHQLVTAKLDGAGGNGCRTAMAFYRARRAFQTVTGRTDIRPGTLMGSLVSRSPRALFAAARQHCDLRLPELARTVMGHIGLLLLLAILPGAGVLALAQVNGWLILGLAGGLMGAGAALIRLDPRAFGPGMQTVGDVARLMATDNYGALVKSGARSDPTAIWAALVELAVVEADNLPAEQIRPETILLRSQYQKAQARA